MTKEQIYVHIKDEKELKKAVYMLSNSNEDVESFIHSWFPANKILKYIRGYWSLTALPATKTEITLSELEQLLKAEKENLPVGNSSKISNRSLNPQPHYTNELKQFRSLYELQTVLDLNSYEFDILKRLVRCRKKGQFKEDLKKIKDTVDIYLNEFKN